MRKRGAAQFKTGIGRQTFIDVFNLFIAGTIVRTKPKTLPVVLNTFDRLLEAQPNSLNIPEYSVLPLLARSLLLRVRAADLLHPTISAANDEASPIQELQSDINILINDLQNWFDALPAAKKTSSHPNDLYCRNIHHVHQILLRDNLVRIYQHLNILLPEPANRAAEITNCVNTAIYLVDQICSALPFAFSVADLPSSNFNTSNSPTIPSPHHRSGASIMHNLTYSHPLLIASMLYPLSEEKHHGIEFARRACAANSGLSQPLRSYPRKLLVVNGTGTGMGTEGVIWDPYVASGDLDKRLGIGFWESREM
jgi:hypothetical protein